MDNARKNVKYPENLPLKVEVVKSGRTIKELAEKIGYSRIILQQTVNGHYKGVNVVPRLKEELGLVETENL